MKAKTTKKAITYLNYSLSREEQEIMEKCNKILEQVLGTIEDYTNVDLNNQQELIDYFYDVFGEDVEAYSFSICGIIDTIINYSDTDIIIQEDDQSKVHK